MKILTARQMEEVDRLTTENCGIPSIVLMENAAFGLCRTLEEYFEDLSSLRVTIVCGRGNNGGDGFALARQLLLRDVGVSVFLLGRSGDLQGDCRVNWNILVAGGVPVTEVENVERWMELEGEFATADIVVDALLGTGINRPVDPDSLYGVVVASINTLAPFVLSVDIPSGMISDEVRGGDLTVLADATTTFTAPKIAQVLNRDLDAVGDLHIVPIGTPIRLLEEAEEHFLEMLTSGLVRSLLPARSLSAHKGDFGHVAVIAGSLDKSGAAALAAGAAIRSGSGLVTACTPTPAQPLVAAHQAEIMTRGLSATPEGTFSRSAVAEVLSELLGKDAAAIGPGIGATRETFAFVRGVIEEAQVALVVDADGLNALAEEPDTLGRELARPLILTPHPGEFARLTRKTTKDVLDDPVGLARSFATERAVWLVLKGFRTLVATPDGQVFVCPLGNPGMATAGMGDVLTGVALSLLGQNLAQGTKDVTAAVLAAVFVHAFAGDLAEEEVGADALNAGDVVRHLASAFESIRSSESR